MPFHTVAWRLSIADATATDITPVQDLIMAIQNGHFMPQFDMFLYYAYFGAATPNRARLISPSFRQLSTPWIRPVNTDIVPGDRPGIADYRANPLRIRALEELQLEGMQTTGGAAVVAAVAALARNPIANAPAGDIITMRGTGTTTAVAGSWTSCPITWQDTLQTGRYAVVGLNFVGATALAARLVFEEQWERPGCIGCSSADLTPPDFFLRGGLGMWGNFNANRMPNIEILCNAADTAQEIYLDFVRVG